VLAVLPLSHVYGVVILMTLQLWRGVPEVCFPRFDLEGYLRAAQDYRSRTLYIVPPIVAALAKQPAVEAFTQATFSLAGQPFMCIDSPVKHDFGFTPAMSLFVRCETEAELDRLYATLAEQGTELMPLGDYGFSAKFGWVNDRFGVSWQLNLPG
jgi:uncharacterized glyoxalase superfamily protein PhnB